MLKVGLGSGFGVGYIAAFFAAGVWKKLETEAFWEAAVFCVEPFCVGGGDSR